MTNINLLDISLIKNIRKADTKDSLESVIKYLILPEVISCMTDGSWSLLLKEIKRANNRIIINSLQIFNN